MTTTSTNSAPTPTRRNPLVLLEPTDEAAAIATRIDEWDRRYAPEAGYPEWVMQRVVIATMRLDRVIAEESALRVYEAERARLSWGEDRRLAVEEIGARLSKDPERVRRRLELTRQGADWLIERWDALGRLALLDPERGWTDPQRSLALDLLGIPADLRDGPAPFDPAPGQPLGPTQAAAAEAERTRLVRLCERILIARDGREQALACSGAAISFSPAMTLLHRQEALWTREYHRALSEFCRTTRRPADPTPNPTPVPRPAPPAPPPPPAPEPEGLAAPDRSFMARLLEKIRSESAEDEQDVADAVPLDMAPAASPSRASSFPATGNRRSRRARLAKMRSAG